MEEQDERPLVKDLLEKHANKIAELKAILEKEESYSAEHYDDLWVLRFLLSHKKVSKASKAAIHTMNFRQERKMNEMGDVRWRANDHTDPQSDRIFPCQRKYMEFCKTKDALMFTQPDPDRGVVQIIFPGKIDMTGVVDNMTADELLEGYLLGNEVVFQIVDEVTRRTGRLTKVLRIMDGSDFALSSFNSDYIKRDAAANKQLEDFYPQLLGTVVYANMPGWAHAIWRMFKPFFPKRFVEKVAVVQPLKYPKDTKYFLKYVSKDKLWEKYGGDNSTWPVEPMSHLWEK